MAKHYDEAEKRYIEAQGRFDETTSAFLARELTHIRAQVLQVKKAPLNAFSVFPVQTDILDIGTGMKMRPSGGASPELSTSGIDRSHAGDFQTGNEMTANTAAVGIAACLLGSGDSLWGAMDTGWKVKQSW